VTWRDLETAAPEIARLGRARLEDARVALLGTLRKDGSPRISPIEPFFAEDDLLLGAMAWSLKVRDLRRDPRCVLHSAVSGPESGEGELKLYGRAAEVEDERRDACPGAWWLGRPRDSAWVFALEIVTATFLEWDYARGVMIVNRWSADGGFEQRTRPYP
jgi:hypothetical protein